MAREDNDAVISREDGLDHPELYRADIARHLTYM